MSQQMNLTPGKSRTYYRLNLHLPVRAAMFVLLLTLSTAAHVARAQNESSASQSQNNPPNVNLNNPEGLNDYLSLTETQKTQIRAIREQNQVILNQLQRQQRQAERALNEAIYSGSATDAEIEARTREYAAAHEAFIRRRALKDSQVIRVLTPDQRLKLGAALRQAQIQKQLQQQRQRQERRQQRLEKKQQNPENNDVNKPPQNPNPANGNTPRNNAPANVPHNNRGNLPHQNLPRPNRVRPRLFVP